MVKAIAFLVANMRKRIWVVLLMILTVVAVIASSGGWDFSPPRTQVPLSQPNSQVEDSNADRVGVANAQEPSPPPVSGPPVAPPQLMADVEALAFKRYTEADRQLARNYIAEQLTAAGWEPRYQEFEGGINILAERLGTNPDAGTILVGAHYDTVKVSPGADDNATGVAVVLEVARKLGKVRTPRSLQVAFFDEEEIGLRGSGAFAATEALPASLRGVIILDMVGFACYTPGCQKYPDGLPVTPTSDRGDFLAIIGDQEHLPLLEMFHRSTKPGLPPVFTLPVPFKGLLTPDTLRSDHAPFWYQGIGAALVTDTANLRTPHYHKSTDTLAHIDRSFFAGAAQLVVNATTGLLESQESLATAPLGSASLPAPPGIK